MSDGNRKDGSGASQAHPKDPKEGPTTSPSAETSPNSYGGYTGEPTDGGDEGARVAETERSRKPEPKP